MPDKVVVNAKLPADGTAIEIPPLTDADQSEYRVVVRGAYQVGGATFTPESRFRQGDTDVPYLRWSPNAPTLVRSDPARMEWEYRVTADTVPLGQSLSLRLDMDRLVDRFLITRSEILDRIGGGMTVDVERVPLVIPFPWAAFVGVAAAGGLAAGGFAWIVRRRMLLQGLAPDLLERVNRIQAKAEAARRAIRQQSGALPLKARIETLSGAALPLARQAADLRKAQVLTDPATLKRDIEALELRRNILAIAEEAEAARHETEATLAEKQKALVRRDELARAEALCVLRLEKIEAILDSTALTLHSAQAHTSEPASEEHLRKALDAEVAAVHAVARETPRVELTLGRR